MRSAEQARRRSDGYVESDAVTPAWQRAEHFRQLEADRRSVRSLLAVAPGHEPASALAWYMQSSHRTSSAAASPAPTSRLLAKVP
jgi:hypothetical protein